MKKFLFILLVFCGGGVLGAWLMHFIIGGLHPRTNTIKKVEFKNGKYLLKVVENIDKHSAWYFVSFYQLAPEVPLTGTGYILSTDSLGVASVTFTNEPNSTRLSFAIPGYSKSDVVLVGKVINGKQEWTRRESEE